MRLFLTAGEPSGDRLGAALIAGLRQIVPDLEVVGVGGPLMAAEGLESLFPMEELSVMGLAEIVPRYRALMRRIDETAAAVLAAEPDALITIDAPDFSSRVSARVRARRHVHTVHYVAPTVWAWRPGRAEKLAPLVDHVLALLPFEPPYMEEAGIRCTFVGHPVVSEAQASRTEAAEFRRARALSRPAVLVLPGSRRSEIRRMTPIFGKVMTRVATHFPQARAVLPTMPGLIDEVSRLVADWPVPPVLVDSTDPAQKRAAFAAADVALTKSGTVSLELAAAGTPMVVAHDMNWITRQVLRRMIRTDTVTLVNLVSETRAVPEFLGGDCRPDRIAPALIELIGAPRRQSAALERTMLRLGREDEAPGLRAARAVLEGLAAERAAAAP